MDYKKYFADHKINTIESFFKYMQNNFSYGWIDKNGKNHEGFNDATLYSLQSPKELLNSHIGICWDMTELARCFFKNMTTLKYETYYLFYDDNEGCPSHSILVFYNDDEVYWFEPMFNDNLCFYSGIHKYNNILELLTDFKRVFIKNAISKKFIKENYDNNKFYIYKYNQPKYHINGHEMREHIDNSILINL
ncbi:MAG: hypothetical protein NC483_04610 [Ruminococcus sp.]|nr:hypothetical protein [Ruminococcus sp.]